MRWLKPMWQRINQLWLKCLKKIFFVVDKKTFKINLIWKKFPTLRTSSMLFESTSCFAKLSEFNSTANEDSSSSLKIVLMTFTERALSFKSSVSEITLSLAKRPQCDCKHDGCRSGSKLSDEHSTLCSLKLKTSLIPANVVVFSLLDVK